MLRKTTLEEIFRSFLNIFEISDGNIYGKSLLGVTVGTVIVVAVVPDETVVSSPGAAVVVELSKTENHNLDNVRLKNIVKDRTYPSYSPHLLGSRSS